jgi:hypothetical protein
MPSFRDSLKERGTVQILTVSREVALEVQVNFLQFYVCGKYISLTYAECKHCISYVVQSLITGISSFCNGCDSIILFQDLLVSTTLPPVCSFI